MKNEDKKCLKRVLCFLLVSSLIMAPFMGNSIVKASEVNDNVLTNETENINITDVASKSSIDVVSNSSIDVGTGGSIQIIHNPYIGEGYEVKFDINSQWQGGYNGSITITNTGSKTIENWELAFQSKDNFKNIWNALIVSHEGNTYKIKNAGWNQDIEPGKSVSFGFGATFENEVTIPTEYKMLGEIQEVSEEKCKITYSIGSQWNTGYIIEVTLTNLSDIAIEDWEVVFDLGHEITNIWNGSIISHENGHYDIKNCGYNGNISAGGSVTFGFQASITDKNIALLPTNGVMKQVSENNAEEPDQDWSQKMINADAENVIAARNKVNDVVKIALIDSGVDYSEKVNVVARKNFIPDYAEEDLNPMFDDLNGHGTAVAALIASNPVKQTKDTDSGNEGNDDSEEEQTNDLDFSYLLEQDKITLTPQLDQELIDFLTEQGEEINVTTGNSLDVETQGLEESLNESSGMQEAGGLEEAITEPEDDEFGGKINGINPNVKIYSARVLDSNNESSVNRVIEAIDWAISQDVNIINLSWGIDEDIPELHAVIQKAYQNGILIIAAAGNSNNIQYPAKYDEVMAVGSVKCTGKKADTSATGEELEVVAPGQDIYSSGPFGTVNIYSGTSMAAPQVTGLASILWQKDMTKSNEFIRQLIDATANNLGDKNIYGYGLIDCEYAVNQYDNFANSYIESNANFEEFEQSGNQELLNENPAQIDFFTQETIKGSWGPSGHNGLIDLEDEKNQKIVRLGANWSDDKESGLKGMKLNPWFHGYYKYDPEGKTNDYDTDYIAAYIYLTEQAVNYLETGKYKEIYSATGAGIEKMHTKFTENIKNAWDKNKYGEKDNVKKFLFVYGMALHTVGDIFAHSTYAYQEYSFTREENDPVELKKNIAWSRLSHGYTDKEGDKGDFYSNSADDKKIYPKRYECALKITENIIAGMPDKKVLEDPFKLKHKDFAKYIGDVYDFDYSKYPNIYNVVKECDKLDPDSKDYEKSVKNKRVEYLKKAFGIVKFDEYICSKIEDTDKHLKYINRIKGITNSNILEETNNWKIAKIKISDKLKVKFSKNILQLYVYKVVNGETTRLEKDDYIDNKNGSYTLVMEKGAKYIISIKVIKQKTKSINELSLLSISDTAERYVCTKEITCADEISTYNIESENYQIMCLGNEIELDEDDFVTASLGGKIAIADTDSDNGNDKLLSNAIITLTDYNDDSYQTTTTSSNQGTYEFADLAPGIYKMLIQKEGYIDTKYTVIIHSNENNVFNPVIAMISESYEGDGSASGKIIDAATGYGVEGLTLRIRKGIGETKGEILIETKTVTEGFYQVKDLPVGYYTVQIIDERDLVQEEKYRDGIMTIRILGKYTLTNQNGVVSNDLTKEQIRIILTWGAVPRDLDSHLIGKTSEGGGCHVYWNNKVIHNSQNIIEIELDLDDVSSYGPETTTIYRPIDDNYEFYVHNLTADSSQELMNSGAMVQVYKGCGNLPWFTFYVPQGEGFDWYVFRYNGETGILTPTNVIR